MALSPRRDRLLIWYELSDPTTDRFFYANPYTGQCSWEQPPGRILQEELPEWWELWDSESQNPYYFNNTTQETHWELPLNLDVVPVPLSLSDDEMMRNALAQGYVPHPGDVNPDEEDFEPSPAELAALAPSSAVDYLSESESEDSFDRAAEYSVHLDERGALEALNALEALSGAPEDETEYEDETEQSLYEQGYQNSAPSASEPMPVDSFGNQQTNSTLNVSLTTSNSSAPQLTSPSVSQTDWPSATSASTELACETPPKVLAPLAPGWTEEFDDNYNVPFYYNHDTGNSTWIRSEAEVPNWKPPLESKSLHMPMGPSQIRNLRGSGADLRSRRETTIETSRSVDQDEFPSRNLSRSATIGTEQGRIIKKIQSPFLERDKSGDPEPTPTLQSSNSFRIQRSPSPNFGMSSFGIPDAATIASYTPSAPTSAPASRLPPVTASSRPPVQPTSAPVATKPPTTSSGFIDLREAARLARLNSQAQLSQNWLPPPSSSNPPPLVGRPPVFASVPLPAEDTQVLSADDVPPPSSAPPPPISGPPSKPPPTNPALITNPSTRTEGHQRSHSSASNSTSTSAPALSPLSSERKRLESDEYTPTTEQRERMGHLSSDIAKFQLAGFAQQFFALRKKGLFARKYMPLAQLIQFQAEPLPGSLLRKGISNKDSISIFKRIQSYMGDRGRDPGKPQTARYILERGIRKIYYRDEIYCLICKQITNNPRPSSEYMGWELLTLSVILFPPSRGLHDWLLGFIANQRSSSDDKIQKYAKFAFRQLKKISLEGGKGVVPTIEQIAELVTLPFKRPVFGVSLEEIMAYQKESDPALDLPKVLVLLAEEVEKLGGHQTEGIFRGSGTASEMTSLRLQIENGDYAFRCSDPHVPGSLLKLWLRELAEPLIPSEYYEAAIQTAHDPAASCALVNQLDSLNQRVIRYLVAYIRKLTRPQNIALTKMSVNNLAMVFAPNFLRCPADDPAYILACQRDQQTFVRNLITDLK